MTFEDVEHGAAIVLIAALVLLQLVTLLLNTPGRVEKRVLERARRDRLPRDDESFAASVRRDLRETRFEAVGASLGMLAGAPALLVDFGLVGAVGPFLGGTVGHSIATWAAYGRPPVGAPPRRVRDYLSPAERWLATVALLAGATAVVVQVSEPHERSEELLVIVLSGVVLLFCAATVPARRRILRLEHRVASAAAAVWAETDRVHRLRDVQRTQLSLAGCAAVASASLAWSPDSASPGDLVASIGMFVVMGLSLAQSILSDRPAHLRGSER